MAVDNWLDAQTGVIGSLLISPELVPRVLAETTEKDFRPPCLTVYKAIKSLFLAGTPVDPISVLHALGGGTEYRDYLVQIMDATPTAANIDTYIRLCREQSRLAAARDIGSQLAQVSTNEEAQALLEQAGQLMASRQQAKAYTMAELLTNFYDRHDPRNGRAGYLSWPIRELENELFVEPGDFIILGGRPSTGKSAFALQCAWHWAKTQKVGFFSLETGENKLFDRKMSGLMEIPMQHIKRNTISDAKWAELAQRNQEILAANLEIIPASGMTVTDVRAQILLRGYRVVIVDYLQLLRSKGENRYQQVTNISLQLHTMAQSLGVTVVALCQLSRLGDKKHPDMSDLRESGQIEQDADVVLLLSLENELDLAGNRILNIAKNKEGECPCIALAFDGRHQTFSKAQMLDKLADFSDKSQNRPGDKAQGTKSRGRSTAKEQGQMAMLPDDTPVPESFREG